MKRRLVRIIWHDAASLDEWSESSPTSPLIESVGYIVQENAHEIVIAADVNDECYARQMVIPRGCIAPDGISRLSIGRMRAN